MLYDAFLTYIRCELILSAHTVSSYTSDLKAWRQFADEQFGPGFSPLDADINHLRLWVARLSADGASARTIRRKIQTLRALFRYLMKRHGATTNPAAELTLARAPKHLPDVIRPEDTARVLDRSVDITDFTDLRDRLIIEMLYSTGMRASELTSLKNFDINTTIGELKVLGKRNKERIIPFGKKLSQMIETYRNLRPAGAAVEFFVQTSGKPLSYHHVLGIVRREFASTTSHPTPHALRHSFATDMLNDGADIHAVQKLLGHASLATTQIYTHLSYTELQQNYQLAHPRAQKKG